MNITLLERRTKPGTGPSLYDPSWWPGSVDVHGWSAEVTVDGGLSLSVSRLDGEGHWTIDAAFRLSNGYPMWSNGYGARYLLTKTLAAPYAAELDAAVAALAVPA